MKQITLIMLVVLGYSSYGQSTEFEIHENGLMYSEETMNKLGEIVDKLNIKYRACELTKTYYSKKNGIAHYIRLEGVDVETAEKDMKGGMPYDAFIQKYPKTKAIESLPIIEGSYIDYSGDNTVFIQTFSGGHEIEYLVAEEAECRSADGKRIWKTYKKGEPEEYSLYGYFIMSELERKALPEKYAKLIQYSDCMVDTTTQIFADTDYECTDETEEVLDTFMERIAVTTHRPVYDRDNSEGHYEALQKWRTERFVVLDKMAKEGPFRQELIKMVKLATDSIYSNEDLELYAGRYISKHAQLNLKRIRRVYGRCSRDNRPREHAMDIAILSAETINWEVFLRAHLDILNDNFSRASDGSYAWAERSTYLKELEELDINVLDLMLGISLRIDNPSSNHYYGSIRRVGRALAEYHDKAEVESRMLAMIQDDELDLWNRALMYYLYLNYNSNLHRENETEFNAGVAKAKAALKTTPEVVWSYLIKEK